MVEGEGLVLQATDQKVDAMFGIQRRRAQMSDTGFVMDALDNLNIPELQELPDDVGQVPVTPASQVATSGFSGPIPAVRYRYRTVFPSSTCKLDRSFCWKNMPGWYSWH